MSTGRCEGAERRNDSVFERQVEMARQQLKNEMPNQDPSAGDLTAVPLWQLDIVEVTGHNIEAKGRDEVNRLLAAGWKLLLIYTLKYQEDGVWRERPMAILGKPRTERG